MRNDDNNPASKPDDEPNFIGNSFEEVKKVSQEKFNKLETKNNDAQNDLDNQKQQLHGLDKPTSGLQFTFEQQSQQPYQHDVIRDLNREQGGIEQEVSNSGLDEEVKVSAVSTGLEDRKAQKKNEKNKKVDAKNAALEEIRKKETEAKHKDNSEEKPQGTKDSSMHQSFINKAKKHAGKIGQVDLRDHGDHNNKHNGHHHTAGNKGISMSNVKGGVGNFQAPGYVGMVNHQKGGNSHGGGSR